jgi:hypothetical protein
MRTAYNGAIHRRRRVNQSVLVLAGWTDRLGSYAVVKEIHFEKTGPEPRMASKTLRQWLLGFVRYLEILFQKNENAFVPVFGACNLVMGDGGF